MKINNQNDDVQVLIVAIADLAVAHLDGPDLVVAPDVVPAQTANLGPDRAQAVAKVKETTLANQDQSPDHVRDPTLIKSLQLIPDPILERNLSKDPIQGRSHERQIDVRNPRSHPKVDQGHVQVVKRGALPEADQEARVSANQEVGHDLLINYKVLPKECLSLFILCDNLSTKVHFICNNSIV